MKRRSSSAVRIVKFSARPTYASAPARWTGRPVVSLYGAAHISCNPVGACSFGLPPSPRGGENAMLALDPRTTALVLIDVQKGVLAMPLAPRSAAQIVQNAARLGLHFEEVGAVVALVHVGYSGGAVDRLSQPVDAPPSTQGAPAADYSDFAP